MPLSPLSTPNHVLQIYRNSNSLLHKVITFSASTALASLDFTDPPPHHKPQNPNSQNPNSSYLQLRSQLHHFARSGSCPQALEVLNSMRYVTVKDYNALLYYYLKSQNVSVEMVGQLYGGMAYYGLRPSALTFLTILNGLLPLGRLELGYYFALQMYESGFVPSYRVLFRLLKKSLRCRDLVLACSLLELMLKLHYLPKRCMSNLLISSLCRDGMVEKGYSVFLALSCNGFLPCGFSYNPMLWALCKSDQSCIALALLCLVKKRGYALDVCSYTALVHGFGKEGLLRDAFGMLHEMQGEGCNPNKITYTTLVKHLCDHGEIAVAICVLDKMRNDGWLVDVVPYNVILRALLQKGRISEADEIMQVASQSGFSPDSFTHTATLGGLLKSGRVINPDKLMLDILASSSFVDVPTFNIYLHMLCSRNRSTEALSLMESMMKNGFKPTNTTYNTILKGLCREKHMDRALELLDRFEWADGHPDLIAFNTLLSAACKSNDSSLVKRILYRMECENIKLNVVGSTCLLQYFLKARKHSASFQLWDSMISNGPNPTVVSFNVLLNGLCKNGSFGIAYRIFMENTTICLDTTSYNILIYAALRKGDHFLVDQLISDMHNKNINPDVITYRSLISGLCKQGNITSALYKLDEAWKNGLNPGTFAYNIILYAIFRRGKLHDVVFLLKHMGVNNCKPDMYTYDIWSKAKSRGRMKRIPEFENILELMSWYN